MAYTVLWMGLYLLMFLFGLIDNPGDFSVAKLCIV